MNGPTPVTAAGATLTTAAFACIAARMGMRDMGITPGEFLQHPNGLGGATTMIWVDDGETPEKGTVIAKHVHGVHNARLFAASKDLLRALEMALEYMEGDGFSCSVEIAAAKAAILKARGKS